MMRRADRGGLGPGGVAAVALLTLAAILAMVLYANRQWSGMSAREQLYQAVFVAKDWD